MDRVEAAFGNTTRRIVRTILNLLLVAAIGLLIFAEAKAVTAWYFTRETVKDCPQLVALPKPLLDLSLPVAKEKTTITLSGCSLSVPWVGGKSKSAGSVYFPDRGGILFFNPAQTLDAAGLYRSKSYAVGMTKVLGSAAIQSNYDLTSAELNAKPSDVTLLTTLPKIARQLLLLQMKSIFVNKTTGGPIYSVAVNQIRGFQIGDPALHPKAMGLIMFDHTDREFHVLVAPAKSYTLTQPEINFIIQSMSCEDDSPTARPVISR